MQLEHALIYTAVGFVLGVSGQYIDAKEWLDSHRGCDLSFYEHKMRSGKDDCLRNKIAYYLGYFGRQVAYRERAKSKRE
jgi:hypothetical protein